MGRESREKRKRKREKEKRGGRSVTCQHPSGTKASDWQGEGERQTEEGTKRARIRAPFNF